MSTKYLALLRGINVGGHNIIRKDALRGTFEDLGFESVKTYIQSGNILFRSGSRSAKKLAEAIEGELSARFGYAARAVVLAHRQYQNALASAHDNWGTDGTWKHNALFTIRSTTPAKVLKAAPPLRPGIDEVTTGPGAIFWSVPVKTFGKSGLAKFAATKGYKEVTVRNHKTVYKLLELFDEL